MQVFLRGQRLDNVDLMAIAKRTNGYSGSDLKQVCRFAAMIPIRERIREESKKLHARNAAAVADVTESEGKEGDGNMLAVRKQLKDLKITTARMLEQRDMLAGLARIPPTGVEAMAYYNKFKAQTV